MDDSFSPVVNVSGPTRGSSLQQPVTFRPSRLEFTTSWGLQPGSGFVEWVSETPVDMYCSSEVVLTIGSRTFTGITRGVVRVVRHSDGFAYTQDLADHREYLQWDYVHGSFNVRDSKIVDGELRKRYVHVLPVNAAKGLKTYTDAPYTARQILDFLFDGPSVESPWARTYCAALDTPVYGVDVSGRTLGQAIVEISEKLGTVFTIGNTAYHLFWVVKGTGDEPVFPPCEEARRGTTLSGHPTRMLIEGGKNHYQVLNQEMVADWLPAMEQFLQQYQLDLDIFTNERTEAPIGDIPSGTRYNAIPGDEESLIGWQLAGARAATITVGDYAKLRDARLAGSGDAFRDYRKHSGRSRLQIPMALYLSGLLFRAFRFPPGFMLININGASIPPESFELVEKPVVEVSHDPATGVMSYTRQVISNTNGYVIVKGYRIGSDEFKTIRPEYFDTTKWIGLQAVWQSVSFSVDDSGEGSQFIIMEEPVINSDDLLEKPVIGGAPQNYAVTKANPVITHPQVRAGLVLEAEPFRHTVGAGTRDGYERVTDLNGEFVATANGTNVELPFADGKTGSQKAEEIGNNLLLRQTFYEVGGWSAPGISGVLLSGRVDRITIRLTPSDGLTETVDLTSERQRNSFDPERDFDRRSTLLPLLTGERELKEQSRAMRRTAVSLRRNPEERATVLAAFDLAFGRSKLKTTLVKEGSGTLPVGTPLWKEAGGRVSVMPTEISDLTSPVLAGVTVRNNEGATGPVPMATHGQTLARVKGPVEPNQGLGRPDAGDYFVVASGEVYALAMERVETGVVKLIEVRLGGGGGGESLPIYI